MFSPSAENLSMPGRLDAAPRSRCSKSPVLAMCWDQSAAMLARSASHVRVSRPLACRSALRRANSCWVIFSATVLARLVAGAPVEDGAAAVVLGRLVVVGALVVAGALVVVVAAGFRLAPVVAGCAAPALPPGMVRPTLALVWVALPLVLAWSAVEPRGRASAGIRNHASTSGSTIMTAMRRLRTRAARAWRAAGWPCGRRFARLAPCQPLARTGRSTAAGCGRSMAARDPWLAADPSWGTLGDGQQQRRNPAKSTRPMSNAVVAGAARRLADLAVDDLDGRADDREQDGDADQDGGGGQRQRELIAQPGDGQHAHQGADHGGQDGDAERVERP